MRKKWLFWFGGSGIAFQRLRVLAFDPQWNFASTLMFEKISNFSKKYFFDRSKNIFSDFGEIFGNMKNFENPYYIYKGNFSVTIFLCKFSKDFRTFPKNMFLKNFCCIFDFQIALTFFVFNIFSKILKFWKALCFLSKMR